MTSHKFWTYDRIIWFLTKEAILDNNKARDDTLKLLDLLKDVAPENRDTIEFSSKSSFAEYDSSVPAVQNYILCFNNLVTRNNVYCFELCGRCEMHYEFDKVIGPPKLRDPEYYISEVIIRGVEQWL